MTGISVLKPMEITPAMLVSTDVPETDYPEWNSGGNYNTGDRVIVTSTHKVYRSVIDGNTGKDPTTDRTSWQEVGATNRWKPFDKSVTTQVVQSNLITYRLKPGKTVTSLSILNVNSATSVRVRLIDPVYGTVYDRTISLARIPVAVGWWAWFFGERREPTQMVINDLPNYPTADILIEITGGSLLAIGVILLGRMRTFGMGVKVGMQLGILDYSRKERNDFGDVIVVERPFSKRINFSMLLKSAQVDEAHRFFSDVRATPCLWIVSNRFEASVAYAFYRNFNIVVPYYDYSDCDLELEGLT